MTKPKLGIALCGSYCTYEKLFGVLGDLAEEYELVPIMSETAANTDTRFGTATEHMARLETVCGRAVISSIRDAEPLGPSEPLDALVIAPCTGNTLAKLALGATDSAVLMAAKAHLRNGRPLVIAFSTNDALGASAANIAALLVRKNVYFVPFRQDDHIKKPRSMASDFTLIADTVAAALRGEQLQPLIAR